MERKKASDFAQGLLELFDSYVHGGISRRGFLDGAQKFAVGGVTAAALLAMLRPNYALAVQIPPDDPRIVARRASAPSPLGNAGHDFTCTGLSASDKTALIAYLQLLQWPSRP